MFNDDTLSPGAVWPLHPHRDNEVVTYCACGEFRHEDERGKGGILRTIVYNSHPGALRIVSDAAVYSCFLEKGKKANHTLGAGRGAYSTYLRADPWS